jgi:hypothetical protein
MIDFPSDFWQRLGRLEQTIGGYGRLDDHPRQHGRADGRGLCLPAPRH